MQYLFTTGIIRSGTTLLTKMLNVHPDISMASNPYLPLFKSLRDAILPEVDPDSPIDDYCSSETALLQMTRVQAADLNSYPFEPTQYLLDNLAQRMGGDGDSPHLIPYLPMLQGPTYRDLFKNTIHLIEKAQDTGNCSWVGFNDNWVIEFFRPLARAFPEAKFVVILRDPRAIVYSVLGGKDPALIPDILSLLRHWRKYISFVSTFQNDLLFDLRLYVLTYEDLVGNPAGSADQLTKFLGVDFVPDMLNPEKYADAFGDNWKENSTIGGGSGIFTSSVQAWQKMDEGFIKSVEFICWPEMESVGYHCQYPPQEGDLSLLRSCYQGWTSSRLDIESEIESERSRLAQFLSGSMMLRVALGVVHAT